MCVWMEKERKNYGLQNVNGSSLPYDRRNEPELLVPTPEKCKTFPGVHVRPCDIPVVSEIVTSSPI